MIKNVGFISVRFAGTDGVSLESSKWADFFEKNGLTCFWFAGELDRDADKSLLVPEAHFQYGKNKWINSQIMGTKGRKPEVTQSIHALRARLKKRLHDFIREFNIDLLVAENILSLPMHIPLGLALTEAIAETRIPTIAHHHDFYWERARFAVNAAHDFIRMAFPPNLSNIKHVVINSEAQEQLALRTGISSVIIPNVLDFDNPPVVDKSGLLAFRESIGLKDGDRIILQPTRIVQRKGIEHAIELIKELDDSRNKLVISHDAGDEGFEYARWLKEYACKHQVDLRLVSTQISKPWEGNGGYRNRISLWEVYPYADFITYPSLAEGFGNAFLEAIYFKKPILINRYGTFIKDIEPHGFDLAVMDGFLSRKTVDQVKELLESPQRREMMVDINYEVASRLFSYAVLRDQFDPIMKHFFNVSFTQLRSKNMKKKTVNFPIKKRLVLLNDLDCKLPQSAS